MDTLLRSLVIHALLTKRSRRYPNNICLATAAQYLGVNTSFIYNKLKKFKASGNAIELENKIGRWRVKGKARSTNRKHNPTAKELLKILGVPFVKHHGPKIWTLAPEQIMDLLKAANKARLTALKICHPDAGQKDHAQASKINDAWRLLRQIFSRNGFTL